MKETGELGDRLPDHPLFVSLFSRTTAGIRPGLDVIQDLLARLGNPQDAVPALHVAGTNGKGSVCAHAEALLREAGVKVFLYTSPHLIRYNERFRFDGQDVEDGPLVAILERILAADEEAVGENPDRRGATFFEVTTAAAFLLARELGAEVSVIETGLGGRWDATRVCRAEGCAITRIGKDHEAFLGDDVLGIAREKAGIMRPGVPVVVAPQRPEVMAVLHEEAEHVGADLIPLADEVAQHGFQACNAHHARRLVGTFLEGRKESLPDGTLSIRWPGRFQQVSEVPPMWIDGAHNEEGVAALIPLLEEAAGGRNIGLLFGFLADKDGARLARRLASVVTTSWVVPVDHPRGADEAQRQQAVAALPDAQAVNGLASGWEAAKHWALEQDGIVILCGSLYLIGEALETTPWKEND